MKAITGGARLLASLAKRAFSFANSLPFTC